MGIQSVDVLFGTASQIVRAAKNSGASTLKRGTPVMWDRSANDGISVIECDGTEWMGDFAGILMKELEAGKSASNAICVAGRCFVNFTGHASATAGTYATVQDDSYYATYSAQRTPLLLLTDMSGDTDNHLVEDDGIDSAEVWLAPSGKSHIYSLGSPALGVAEEIVANAICTSSAATTATLAGQPDVARNLQFDANSSATLTDVSSGTIVVVGTNIHGEAITENLQFVANSSGPVQSALAYKTVTSITFPAQDGAGAAFEVKRGAKLGLPTTLHDAVQVVNVTLNGVIESTAPTIVADADEVEKNLISLNSALAGTAVKVAILD